MRKPLPSWTDGAVSEAIVQFVRRVTNPAHVAYVEPDERVAVFDGDGTLWCEQPTSALAFFVMHRLSGLSPAQAIGLDGEYLRAAREGDYGVFQSLDPRRLSEVVLLAHTGLTAEQFSGQAHRFLGEALHPRFGVPFGQLAYRPMLELLAFLHGKHFRVFIVTAGGVEFVHVASEELYGVPRERVAGATVNYSIERLDGKILLIRTRTLSGDPGEGEAKVRAIQQRIGQRPILAVGNAVGDCEMLEYTRSGSQHSLCLVLRHDDAQREYAYPAADAPSGNALLETAALNGWRVISMRSDFRRVFAAIDRQRRNVAHG